MKKDLKKRYHAYLNKALKKYHLTYNLTGSHSCAIKDSFDLIASFPINKHTAIGLENDVKFRTAKNDVMKSIIGFND